MVSLAHWQHLGLANLELCWRSFLDVTSVTPKRKEGGMAAFMSLADRALSLVRTVCTASCLRTAPVFPQLHSCLLVVSITISPGALLSPRIELVIFNMAVFCPLSMTDRLLGISIGNALYFQWFWCCLSRKDNVLELFFQYKVFFYIILQGFPTLMNTAWVLQWRGMCRHGPCGLNCLTASDLHYF